MHATAEVCNSIDDDCDGIIDDAPASATKPGLYLCQSQVTTNQNSVADMTCDQGVCSINTVGGCALNDYDVDGNVADGCECTGSVLNANISGPYIVPVLYNDPSGATSITGILPTPGTEALVKVQFSGIPDPTPPGQGVQLAVKLFQSTAGEFKMDVRDSTNAPAACPVTSLGTPSTPDSASGITVWEFVRSHAPNADGIGNCVGSNSDNPSQVCDDTAGPLPPAMLFRIYRPSNAAATCGTFTLSAVAQKL